MGSPVYGQLGDPKAEGKLPTRVEGKLTKNVVEEIACGAYHVAVLTSRAEVYTWGKGANGRLGHGDTDDRNSPSLVEALKDKQVKSIVCGTSFTAAICLHKWGSGVDQSICSGCHLPFNFKRKRHNCYNCGLVYCHICSGQKSVKASMAPNPNKPFRVCDNCFGKLTKATETNSSSHSAVSSRGSMNQGLNGVVEHSENFVSRSHVQLGRNSSTLKKLESGSSKRNKKPEVNRTRVLPLRDGVSQSNALNKSSNPVFGSTKKFFSASLPGSRIMSRATSPTSRRSSPPRATTPTPILSVLASQKFVAGDAKTTSEGLSEEVIKLRAQVEELTHKAQLQEIELERTIKQLKEAIAVAGEETAKCRAAKDVIKSLTAQLKDMAEMLPVGAVRNNSSPSFFNSSPTPAWEISSAATDQPSSPLTLQGATPNGLNSLVISNGLDFVDNGSSSQTEVSHGEAITRNRNRTMKAEPAQGEEWVEQDETGVYITLVALPGGVKDLKRVRFSRKKFSEKQAEQWWAANRARIYQQYNVSMVDKSNVNVGREGLAY